MRLQPSPGSNLPAYLQKVVAKIGNFMNGPRVPFIVLDEWNSEPTIKYEGMIVRADGTNWDPGSGAGIYTYIGAAWSKL